MLRFRSHLLPLLRATSPLHSPTHHRACLLLLSTSRAAFSLEDYLVAACGLAPDQARSVSKQAFEEASRIARKPLKELPHSRLKSASNPDAILTLLSGVGLSRADIAAVVSADPLILRSSVKIIGPRLLALRDRVGLSAPQICRLLLVGSRIVRSFDVCPNLEFLIPFYGSFEQLLAAAKRCIRLLLADLDKTIKPNIELLRQHGLSFGDILQIYSNYPMLLALNPERVKDFVQRVEALRVPRSSPNFKFAVAVVAGVSDGKVAAKLEFLKTALGCSESEVAIAVSRMPRILVTSEERLLPKIQFLLNEVGLEPQYIVERPALLVFSLEKRLVPRHCVLKLLQAKGLLDSHLNFYKLANIGVKTFRLKFIDCHKDSIPGLADAYAAAGRGGVAS